MNIFELDKNYVAPTYGRFDLNIVRGKGSLAYGSDGKEYIDLGSGIAVNSFGFCDDKWIEAVTKQLNTFQHTSNLYYTEPCALLAKKLCELTGLSKVFFSNSGAEANECAIKVARKYACKTLGNDCVIVTLKNSFHGRTLTTLAATGQEAFHEHFTPLTPGFIHIEPTREELNRVISEHKVAAVMFEAVRGEGGVLPLTQDFANALTEAAEKHDILLIADEVQCGNGRSGAYYGYMKLGLTPDVVTTAKGLGGGLPIGATILSKKLDDVFSPGLNGSTFGGNPAVCAGALSVLERIDNDFLADVEKKSAYIFEAFDGADGVESISGMGLMIGIKTVKPAKEVVKKAMEKGVLVLTAKDKVRLLPALNIPMDLLKKAVEILKSICKEDS